MEHDDGVYHDAQLDAENDDGCPYCYGWGWQYNREFTRFTCPDCHGTGCLNGENEEPEIETEEEE